MGLDKKSMIFIIIILILGFLLLCKCNSGPEGHLGETTIDTIKTTHIDTVIFEKTITKTCTILDTIQIMEQTDGTFIYKYVTDISDSLIEGKIITEVTDSMELLSQHIDYIPKFPKYINRVDSVIITKETFLERPKRITLALGLNSTFGKQYYVVGPSLELQLKDKVNINAGYDIVNKGVMFGLHIPILNKK